MWLTAFESCPFILSKQSFDRSFLEMCRPLVFEYIYWFSVGNRWKCCVLLHLQGAGWYAWKSMSPHDELQCSSVKSRAFTVTPAVNETSRKHAQRKRNMLGWRLWLMRQEWTPSFLLWKERTTERLSHWSRERERGGGRERKKEREREREREKESYDNIKCFANLRERERDNRSSKYIWEGKKSHSRTCRSNWRVAIP